MQILDIESTPFATVAYRSAIGGGRAGDVALPLLRGRVDTLPDDLDALLVAGDLQGRVGRTLLGEHLATEILGLAGAGTVPPAARIGVLLAGDLYAAPGADVRGASGDVTAVWEAFAFDFRWAAGVLGNHDTVEARRLSSLQRLSVLDGAVAVRDGLRVAGLGGIIGNPSKPARRSEAAYREGLVQILDQRPDVLVLHESPVGSDRQRGRPIINEVVDGRVPLVVSGHVYWPDPLGRLERGTQVLNVDGRAVLLVAER